MNTIVLSNRKGGAGKTTAAVNLAAEFAVLGKKTLLIDMDSQGHCAVGLGIRNIQPSGTIHRAVFLKEGRNLEKIVLETGIENLSLIPADWSFNHGKVDNSPYQLKEALADKMFSDNYDIIIIDTPPSFDALLINSLVAADKIIIPFVPHQLSYEGIKQLLKALYPIMMKNNPDLKILGFLPSMASDRTRFHIRMKGRIAEEFGTARMLPPIHNSIRLAEAFEKGMPVRFYAPGSRGARDYRTAAEKIMEMIE